ncbi:RHS repeat-associated core domain-containing protein [Chryseobacterium sp. PS-8]|uniref:RHS repeat-associated core domain-containing protein n=1 Tax=Chryseobacterium indicum TaxID=2766954 RepID=A0ABS9C424_9FLAO|nr:RHS repeat-associated core domain-containing protein [Chryseobacterium sp. PS-8]
MVRSRNLVPRFSGMFVDYNVNTRYTYRADGIKLKKIYTYGSGKTNIETSTVTDYLDGFQYEENNDGNLSIAVLKFVPTAEGYYDFEKNKYIYSYTDHLGNIRVSYFKNTNGSAEVLEENNFYPFGMKHEGYNQTAGNPAYSYQYNGKELQKETGWSDYGARMYMSDIARWGVIDPLAEQMRRYSPYTYAYNNPVSNIDPDGRKPKSWDDEQANIMYKVAPEGSLWWVYASGSHVGAGMQGGGDGIGDFFGQMKVRSGGGGGSSASAKDNIDSFVRNGVSYEVAVKVSQNGAISFEEFAYHNTVNDLNHYLNNPKQEGLNLVKLFDSALKNKAGKVLTPDELIKKYKLSPKLKDAINSITVLANNKVKIDWKNETSINMFSKINVYDGILSLQRTFINSPEEPGRGWNGYIVTGGAIEFNDSKTLFIMYNGIYNYYPKTKTISKNGAGF